LDIKGAWNDVRIDPHTANGVRRTLKQRLPRLGQDAPDQAWRSPFGGRFALQSAEVAWTSRKRTRAADRSKAIGLSSAADRNRVAGRSRVVDRNNRAAGRSRVVDRSNRAAGRKSVADRSSRVAGRSSAVDHSRVADLNRAAAHSKAVDRKSAADRSRVADLNRAAAHSKAVDRKSAVDRSRMVVRSSVTTRSGVAVRGDRVQNGRGGATLSCYSENQNRAVNPPAAFNASRTTAGAETQTFRPRHR
jgi:hypothetical protein